MRFAERKLARLPFFFAPSGKGAMYLLYLDDAGSADNSSNRHVILAGIALFERHVLHLDECLTATAARALEDDPRLVEFHASHIITGRARWRRMPKATRRRLLAEGLSAADQLRGKWALFGAVIEKAALNSGEHPLEFAFEQLCSRFDAFLRRMHHSQNTQRGLLIFDRSTRETRLQELARNFRLNGHRWGRLKNIVDVPFFVDSSATRAIQYADMVAYALWRKFEKDDPEFFEIIASGFDAENGRRHGLFMKTLTVTE